MTKSSKWSFDSLFRRLCLKAPLIGKPIANYYKDHGAFQRFVKFGFTGVVLYWLVRAPMTWWFTEQINLSITIPFLFAIPSYLVSAFVVGLILTLVWFMLSEEWVWKGKEVTK